MFIWILTILMLFALEIAYLKLADRLNIIDKPNLRSSHTIPVVRGGGLIFPLSWLIMSVYSGWKFPWFTSGLLILSVISFRDDMRPLSAGQRFIFHIIASIFLFAELSILDEMPIWLIIMLLIAVIGILNAINFMDGINGMTGLYALSFLLPVSILTSSASGPIELNPLRSPTIMLSLSIIVFGFFNFRKRARCFAGDVGSISIGFILVFFLLSFMTDRESALGISHQGTFQTFDPVYILMLSVYGVDTVLTILQRLKLRENIFEAHRRHLYQYMANEMKMPHLTVSLIYGLTQMLINIYVLSGFVTWWGALSVLTTLSAAYFWIKAGPLKRPTSAL
ncbi:MAG: MraY family glycosyltransferase [bacterium]